MGLAVAEAACGFEHRDLHWGNVLLSRDPLATRKTCRLRCGALCRHCACDGGACLTASPAGFSPSSSVLHAFDSNFRLSVYRMLLRIPAALSPTPTLRPDSGVDISLETAGLAVTLIDFTLSRLETDAGAVAFCDLSADPDLFKGPKNDCQARDACSAPPRSA